MSYVVDVPLKIILDAVDKADIERFGSADAEVDIWCQLSAWTVEEATALSIGRCG